MYVVESAFHQQTVGAVFLGFGGENLFGEGVGRFGYKVVAGLIAALFYVEIVVKAVALEDAGEQLATSVVGLFVFVEIAEYLAGSVIAEKCRKGGVGLGAENAGQHNVGQVVFQTLLHAVHGGQVGEHQAVVAGNPSLH